MAIGKDELIHIFIFQRLAAHLEQNSWPSGAFFWGLLTVIFIAVLIGHQSLEVIDRDEARFAQASKQMVLSGDLLPPILWMSCGQKNQ
jgi:4-amino-4-deoxy-L-arabinose transferase-like glycosyltransferase